MKLSLITGALMLAAISSAHADPDWHWRYEKLKICHGWERLAWQAEAKGLVAQATYDYQQAAKCMDEITADMNRLTPGPSAQSNTK